MYSSVFLLSFATLALGVQFKTWVRNNGAVSEFNAILEQNYDIVQQIEAQDSVTVFAPSNGAMKEFNKMASSAQLTGDAMQNLLLYHAIKGAYKLDGLLAAGPFLTTLYNPGTVTGGQKVQVGPVGVTNDIVAYSGLNHNCSVGKPAGNFKLDNGYVQLIDSVLTVPVTAEETAAAAGLTSFVGALSQSSINPDGNDGTWLVPNNQAFQNVASALMSSSNSITSILNYHLVSGGPLYTSSISNSQYGTADGKDVTFTYANGGTALYVNTAAVVEANILVSDGVMHVIDQVLNPANTASGAKDTPAFSSVTAAPSPPFTAAAAAVQVSGTFESGSVHAPPGPLAGPAAQKAATPSAAVKATLSLVVLLSALAGSLVILL